MPGKNVLKTYVSGGFYHVYNRGVAKQDIFKDKQDYAVFLKYLKDSLDKPDTKVVKRYVQGRTFDVTERKVKNFINQIDLLAYCLMPNHFHFLIKQSNRDSMRDFMRSINTRYASFFNKKYDRIGPLFQGRYKAILVKSDEYLLHLTRYIHLNPKVHEMDLNNAYSSYSNYLGLKKQKWVKPDFILKYFESAVIPELNKYNDYRSFVEETDKNISKVLGNLILE